MNKNYIVFQAYGDTDILNELIYSVASLYKQKNELAFEVIVYTDNEQYLRNYLPDSVIYQVLTIEKQREWKGEHSFVHRLKICMLQDLCAKYSGNVLYLDTDTCLIRSPDELFKAIENRILLMFSNEGALDRTKCPVLGKIKKQLCGIEFSTHSGPVTISKDFEMWNAGVLGFTTEQSYILKKVLELTDLIYDIYPQHVTEQLAFSYIFNQEGLLAASNKQIFHYWNFKEFRILLKQFLKKEDSFEKVLENYEKILPVELIKPKMLFEQKPHIVQQIEKHWIKHTWFLPDYA